MIRDPTAIAIKFKLPLSNPFPMEIKKIAFALMLIIGFSCAFMVNPDYRGIKDTGNDNLDKLAVTITLDCDSKDLLVTVLSNSTDDPITGAETTLFYTQYGYQPLPNRGKTDNDGKTRMSVPGTLDYLTGLFILRVDKQNFQSREIEFMYTKCFEAPPPPPKNDSQVPKPPGQNTTPPANQTLPKPPPAGNQSTGGNISANQSQQNGGQNQTQPTNPPGSGTPSSGTCPISAILLLPLAASALIRGRGGCKN